MATQVASLPENLTITDDVLQQLQRLADSQNISLSQALTQAIKVSDMVVRSVNSPDTKVLFKKGNKYTQLTLGSRA